MKSLRIVYHETQKNIITAQTAENEVVNFSLNEIQQKEWESIIPFIQQGVILNLLNVETIDGENVKAEFFILEPDYLIDISSLAGCFHPYGHHPLNYILNRMQNRENTSPILLGNTANFFIDEFVHADENNPVDYFASLKKLFQTSAFEFTACEDLKDNKLEKNFFLNCRKHFDNIKETVGKMFPNVGIDREKLVLEPSFISNMLGLQGRLDIMSHDYSNFIELKSGKAMEDFRTGGQFIHAAESHYIQMILYLAILEFNMDLNPEKISSYLLYSKYPVLSKEKHSRKHLGDALYLRNRIVALEYNIQKENRNDNTEKIIENIDADQLNTACISGRFFENYLRPAIDQFKISFSTLNETEKAYIVRLYTFITKELWLSKVGERDYEGLKRASVLWNATLEDMLTAGEIIYDLKIIDNQAASESHSITLEIPEYENLYFPNFRTGEAIVLYERNNESDKVNNRQVFKGAIESWTGNQLKIRLRFQQKNPAVWNSLSRYAVMHDYMDATYTGMFKALYCFMNVDQRRRDLLLGKIPPLQIPQGENETVSEIFLLLGPPGTGKTSHALKQMVIDEIKKDNTNILLLSYTNRAVDEICRALVDIGNSIPFIRIGSELNCEPELRHYLLENQLSNCSKRSEVAEIISRCRIFAGTVASVWNKPELFNLKQFDLAIIDEATQLLEPHLLGVLSIQTASGENAVKRFVMIGDYKQLPAVVLQSRHESRVTEPLLLEAGLTNLSDSMFERLYRKYRNEGFTQAYAFLSKQGRMHPEISAFPSTYFYEGQLESIGLPHQTENDYPFRRLQFYPVKPSENDFTDKANINEARKVADVCCELYNYSLAQSKVFRPQTVGIIAPYRNQLALIRKCLQETGIDSFSSIMVDTVERFQGSQRDVIIYSFCAKTDTQLNALPNLLEENGNIIDRKLNVVLTRAKKQFILIGNEELLNKNELYRKLLAHIG
ncbi:MAG: AAA family ATPase [Dysgonamonadaceae bacterium]|jgi:broad-specificity NMP kinase|nr:AAA family ATPase [Dysgonamonadaceae bacterium]